METPANEAGRRRICFTLQGGPLPSYKWSYKSIYRGYNPSYPVTSPFIRVITPFITGRGPPCRYVLRQGFPRSNPILGGPLTPTHKVFGGFWKTRDTVDGRNPANQLRLVVYPIVYRVLYIPGG